MTGSRSAPESKGLYTAARWLRVAGRALSLLLLALLLFDWIEAGPGPFTRTVHHDDIREWWATVLMIVAGAGLVIAWRWNLTGGALAAGSMALFLLIGLLTATDSEIVAARLFAAAIFGLPGVFFLLAGLVTRQAHRPNRPARSDAAMPASP